MKLFYITLSTSEQARTLSRQLLEKRLAACTNWFAIQSAYHWEGDIQEATEVVLIIKTLENMRSKIEAEIATVINYTNFIGELEVLSVNEAYAAWLRQTLIN